MAVPTKLVREALVGQLLSRLRRDAVLGSEDLVTRTPVKIADLFGGMGVGARGLRDAGHDVTTFDLNPRAIAIARRMGLKAEVADVRDVPLHKYDAVWMSPPCKSRSGCRVGNTLKEFGEDMLPWAQETGRKLEKRGVPYWIEDTLASGRGVGKGNNWGRQYNAAQFLLNPVQQRTRIVGGVHPEPRVHRPFRRSYRDEFPDIAPVVTASEYKGASSERHIQGHGYTKVADYYGGRPPLEVVARLMGIMDLPEDILDPPPGITRGKWLEELYRAIGNGVPVPMARAFGAAL